MQGFQIANPGPRGPEIRWALKQGEAIERKTLKTGPPFDHTFFNASGHYLYIQHAMAPISNKRAWLISQPIRASPKGSCIIRLHVYQSGINCGYISILTRTTRDGPMNRPYYFAGDLEDMWVYRRYSLKVEKDFQVIIEAATGTGPSDGIALDDISFSRDCRFFDGQLPKFNGTWSTSS